MFVTLGLLASAAVALSLFFEVERLQISWGDPDAGDEIRALFQSEAIRFQVFLFTPALGLASLGWLLHQRPVFRSQNQPLMVRNFSIWLTLTALALMGLSTTQGFILFLALPGLLVAGMMGVYWVYLQVRDLALPAARGLFYAGLVFSFVFGLVVVAFSAWMSPVWLGLLSTLPAALMATGALLSARQGWHSFSMELKVRHVMWMSGLLNLLAWAVDPDGLVVQLASILVILIQLGWFFYITWAVERDAEAGGGAPELHTA